MGKHLAPKPKHELNFIKKQTRVSDRKSERKQSAHSVEQKTPPKTSLEKKRLPIENVRAIPHSGKRQALFLALAFLLMLVVRFLPLEGWMVPAAYAIPMLLALAEIAADAFEAAQKAAFFDRSILACAASILLFATRLYPEAILLLILFGAMGLLESRLTENCLQEHARGLDIMPAYASLISGNEVRRVAPGNISPGEIILVRAGERIPLDGIIVEGITTIDTASVSGQRSPWAVNVGYRVYSGCRNLTSDIKVRVTRPLAQSTAKRLVQLAENALDFPCEQELLAARIQKYFAPAAVLLAILVGVLFPILRGGWLIHLRRAAILLTAACVSTNVYCIPLLYRRTLTMLSGMGVFAKGGDCVETMARAETVIFDKTGTITEGRYAVTDVCPIKMSERQLLTIAAAAECFSRHPIAAAIRESAGKIDERILKVIKTKDIPGRGVSAYLGGRQVFAGNAALLDEHGIRYNIPSRPGTAVHVSVDNRYCGYILVTDKVRRRAFDALETLRVNGIKKLVLLTGDVLSVARPIASRLNFDMLRAELKPEDKAHAVEYLMRNKGGRSMIAFVGEGENNGRIMSGADVGIAMGSLGSDVAMACADVLIMDRDIFKVPRSIALSRRIYRAAWENLFVGFGIQLLILLFSVLGILPVLTAEIIAFAACAAILINTRRIK